MKNKRRGSFRTCRICKVRSSDIRVKSFFRLPENLILQKQWLEVLGVTKLDCKPENFFICEEHFHPDDYKNQIAYSNELLPLSSKRRNLGKRLKPGALPFNCIPETIDEMKIQVELEPGKMPGEVLLSPTSAAELVAVEMTNDEDVSTSNDLGYNSDQSEILTSQGFFDLLVQSLKDISMPSERWNWHFDKKAEVIVFSSYNFLQHGTTACKEIIYTRQDSEIIVRTVGNVETKCPFEGSHWNSIENFELFLKQADSELICSGYPYYRYFDDVEFRHAYRNNEKMRHRLCPIFINVGTICSHCYCLDRYLFSTADRVKKLQKRKKQTPQKRQGNVLFLRTQVKNLTQRLTRHRKRVKQVKLQLKLQLQRLEAHSLACRGFAAKITDST